MSEPFANPPFRNRPFDGSAVGLREPQDIARRLEEFKRLDDGWLDGKGKAPPHAGLDWLSKEWDASYPDDAPAPRLYPTPEGMVRVEWTIGANEVSLDIDLQARTGRWHALDVAADVEDSCALNLSSATSWKWIVGRLQSMTELAHE